MGQRRAVPAKRKKRRMAEADQPAERHHGLQADAEDHQDQGVGRQCLPVRSAPPAQAGQQHQHRNGNRHTQSAPAKAPKFLRWLAHGVMRAGQQTEEPLRAKYQHHSHRQKHQHQRGLRKHADAKRMHHAYQQCRQKCTANAAQPTHHHHDEGLDDHVHVHLQMRRFARQLQGARQPGQRAAQNNRPQHQRLGVYAQRREHVPVLRGRAQALAEA